MSPRPAAATRACWRRACATCTGTAASPRPSLPSRSTPSPSTGWSDLDAADEERLRTLLRPSVSTAATAALDQFSRELEAALSGEPELVERLERLRRRTELGLD